MASVSVHQQDSAQYSDVAPAQEEESNDIEKGRGVGGGRGKTFAPKLCKCLPLNRAASDGDYLRKYLPLYHAARDGDWVKGKQFIDKNPGSISATISIHGATALHIAASYGRSEFVEKIVKHMQPDELEIQDDSGCTALHCIAVGGTVKAAIALVKKNSKLVHMVNDKNDTPLYHLCKTMPLVSTRTSEREMVQYLCSETKDEYPSFCFSRGEAPDMILKLFAAGYSDICLNLFQKFPKLATASIVERGDDLVIGLCAATSEFPSGNPLGFFERLIYKIIPDNLYLDAQQQQEVRKQSDLIQPRTCFGRVIQLMIKVLTTAVIAPLTAVPCIRRARDMKLKHYHSSLLLLHICNLFRHHNTEDIFSLFQERYVLHTAAERGVIEIVAVFLRYLPDMILLNKDSNETLLHVAVENRREKIFNLLMDLRATTTSCVFMRLESGENIMHLAAKLAPSLQLNIVSGPALQMQRELQWFKEVEKLFNNTDKRLRNNDGKTPRELFTIEHKELKMKGEQWMRDTSNSCMVVATLIVTIAFAAAFTVPGGNDSQKGTPIFLHNLSFMVFLFSDALALFSSVTSLIMFLAILTARYAEEDFLISLPRKLIIGLCSLFVAIATTMIAFAASLLTVLGEKLEWIYIPVILFICFPVALFGTLQLPLLVQMIRSTYGRSIFYRPGDSYYRNLAYMKLQ